MAEKKQDNLVYITAKDNMSLNGWKIFIKAGERAGIKKEEVKQILASRNLKKIVTFEK